MKKFRYLLLSGFTVLMLLSCNDLELDPKGMLDDTTLLGNETGVKSYLAGIYLYLPIEEFNYTTDKGYRFGNNWDAAKTYLMGISGEAIAWQNGCERAEGYEYEGRRFWPYDKIREINSLIEKLPDYEAGYEPDTYKKIWGEAHFLRAFYYFGLAKRYGGVPVIDKVISPTATEEELNVFRATESETYRFIHSDLQIAMDNMPARTETGRANRFAAAALMSRAMLYAGTIAKYGAYTTASSEPAASAGYVGIPSGEADWFFTEAYNAGVFFSTQNSGYELVGENIADGDKEKNYVDLFVTHETKEDIFIKQYNLTAPDGLYLRHSYDGSVSPSGDFSNWPGSQVYPTLESVELFQKLPIENADGKPRRFTTRDEMWKDLEPRMLANFYFSGMELRGKTFDIRKGFYRTYTGTMADAQYGIQEAPINSGGNRITTTDRWAEAEGLGRIAGDHGMWNSIENSSLTGIFIRKYVDYTKNKDQAAGYGSSQPWKVFRYAEVLLNQAEAAYELGKKQEAYDLIARIRKRAGATVWTPKGSPSAVLVVNGQTVDENLQYIRDERNRELLFENHRWWDIRRWRVADKVLSQYRPLAVMPYKVINEDKYIFIREYNEYNKNYNFEVKWYYEQIPAVELNKNRNLVQNPIY